MSHYQEKFDTNNSKIPHGKFLTLFQRKLLQKNLHEDLPESYRQRMKLCCWQMKGNLKLKFVEPWGAHQPQHDIGCT
jgi:hypothetical protein